MENLRWALLGTGVIANEMAQAIQQAGRRLQGVCNRTHEKACNFAKTYDVARVYRSYDEMYEDGQVDVIYITTPHNTHYEFIRQSLLHGKHVLAEKSITLNSRELTELQEIAREKGLILGEAMTIWHMPIYKKLWQIVESGRLGRPQIITVNFGSFKEYNMANRFFNMELAGGAMLDIGVYALSLVRGFMDQKPCHVVSQRRLSPAGSDEQATLLLSNDIGQMATIALSLHSKQPKRAMISCEKAYIEIMEFPRADQAVIVDAATGERELIEAGQMKKALQYEFEDMEEAIRRQDPDYMKVRYTTDVMEIMTQIRKDWNLSYPGEHW